MLRSVLLASAFVIALAASGSPVALGAQQPVRDLTLESHVRWVAESLKRMQSIKPGMTRADLLKVFAPEGGLQTGRAFHYRDCLLFHVVVEFEPTPLSQSRPRNAREAEAQTEGLPGDVIKSISRPTIFGAIID